MEGVDDEACVRQGVAYDRPKGHARVDRDDLDPRPRLLGQRAQVALERPAPPPGQDLEHVPALGAANDRDEAADAAAMRGFVERQPAPGWAPEREREGMQGERPPHLVAARRFQPGDLGVGGASRRAQGELGAEAGAHPLARGERRMALAEGANTGSGAYARRAPCAYPRSEDRVRPRAAAP